jgi:hypothetical protein
MRVLLFIIVFVGVCCANKGPYLSLSSKNSLGLGYQIGNVDLNIGIGANYYDDKMPQSLRTTEQQNIDIIPSLLVGYYLFSFDKLQLFINNLFQIDKSIYYRYLDVFGNTTTKSTRIEIDDALLLGLDYSFNNFCIGAGIGPSYDCTRYKDNLGTFIHQSVYFTSEIRIRYYF